MFNFGRKKKKQPDKAPHWFMWLMGLFVAYALLSNIFGDSVSEAQRTQRESRGETVASPINFAVVKGLSVGGPALPLYTRDIHRGHGTGVGCWYTVDVRYSLYNGEGRKVYEITDEDEPERFTIGRREVILALERGILGMYKGGKREISARPELAYDGKRFTHPQLGSHDYVGYILTLVDMRRPPNLPLSDLGLRLYDDEQGDGKPLQCTDDARFRLRAYDVSGKSLFGLESVMVRIGEGIAPYAVERALLGMKPGSKRTVIAPAGYMRPLFAQTETMPDVTEEGAAADSGDEEPESVEIQQADSDNGAPLSLWERLALDHDRSLILEIELLPLQVTLPSTP